VTKPLALNRLGLLLSEKQIPQVVETLKVEVNKKKLWRRLLWGMPEHEQHRLYPAWTVVPK